MPTIISDAKDILVGVYHAGKFIADVANVNEATKELKRVNENTLTDTALIKDLTKKAIQASTPRHSRSFSFSQADIGSQQRLGSMPYMPGQHIPEQNIPRPRHRRAQSCERGSARPRPDASRS